MNLAISAIGPLRGSGLVPAGCRRTYPWFLGLYLGIAPYYYAPNVPDETIGAVKILVFLLAVATTSVAALSSGSFRPPAGLLGPLGFAVLAVLSIPGFLQGHVAWSVEYAIDLGHAAAVCWLFFWIARSGEDLRRIVVPALAILYGILAIQVISMLAASDWNWSRLCGFTEDDPFKLYHNKDGTASVVALWLPAGALLFARRPAWSPWSIGAALFLTILVLATCFMTTARTMMLILPVLSLALMLRREIRGWATGMVIGSALVAATAIASFAVLGDQSCFYYLSFNQQAALFMDRQAPDQQAPDRQVPFAPIRPHILPSHLPEGKDSELMKRLEVFSVYRLGHFLLAHDKIRERPLAGHGFGKVKVEWEGREIHNLWLKFWVYTGVLWPAWFALMAGSVLYRGGQLMRRRMARTDALLAAAGLSVLLVALLMSWVTPAFWFGASNINTVIWAAAGIILGLHGRLIGATAAPSESRMTLPERLQATLRSVRKATAGRLPWAYR